MPNNSRKLVKLTDDELVIVFDDREIKRKVAGKDTSSFKSWIKFYHLAVEKDDNREELLKIGQEIYNWLNRDDHWIEKLLKTGEVPLFIEFVIPKRENDAQTAFIDVPFELLADENGHLAKDPGVKFCPVRRIGESGKKPPEPSEYRLSTLFMAAEPRNAGVPLSYEHEENAILNLYSGRNIDMELYVEESGNIDLLADLANRIKPVDIVHVSCHGNNDPSLLLEMETETGDSEPVTPDLFGQTFSENRPKLIFLSACKSAEQDKYDESYSRSLITCGFPAVLGWSGSVGDSEATRFAAELYRNLTQSATVENAVANARYSLMNPPRDTSEQYESKDWHLARLYFGSFGGGVLSEGTKKRLIRDVHAGIKEFLDKKSQVPVAGRMEFVGRRRQIQDILREFRGSKQHAGVLIHGIGRQGKSSLASRIANRMFNYETVVIYKHYSAQAILNEFKNIAHDAETITLIDNHLVGLKENESLLYIALRELLEDAFSGASQSKKHKPVLMVIDDFERILDDPVDTKHLHNVKSGFREAIIAVIKAFKYAETDSRLIITSRYEFELFDNYDNIANLLFGVSLPSMSETEGRKQLTAKFRANKPEKIEVDVDMARIVKAASGNPGLQDLLFRLLIKAPKTYTKTLTEIEEYKSSGKSPTERKLVDFLQNLAIDNILNLLSEGEKALLQSSLIFELPIPEAVFNAFWKIECDQKESDARQRLTEFGLWEVFEDLVHHRRKAFAINNICKPKLPFPTEERIKQIANQITDLLFESWGGTNGNRPWYCDKQLLLLALISQNPTVVAASGANCIWGMHKNFLTKSAAPLAIAAIELLWKHEKPVPFGLYQQAAEVCVQIGEIKRAEKYLQLSIESIDKPDEMSFDIGTALVKLGRIYVNRGRIEDGLKTFNETKALFEKLKTPRELAIVLGEIARIKVSKGEVDEALKLHQERIQLNRQLGDMDGIASALWDMAQIKLMQKDFQPAIEYLAESYQILTQIGRLDGICLVGMYYGQLVYGAGQKEEGIRILERSRDGFEKLGQTENAEQAKGILTQMR